MNFIYSFVISSKCSLMLQIWFVTALSSSSLPSTYNFSGFPDFSIKLVILLITLFYYYVF